ncbi:MAG TPA: hypothetical protein VER11_03045 [Polyangiaceae bacterium]|nr:hypothetical protein [Polyangiaceae bacterium]
MSIDLVVNIPPQSRLHLGQLVTRTEQRAGDLTHAKAPLVAIEELEKGKRVPLAHDFADTPGRTFILSWVDRDDAVSLTVIDGDEPGAILVFSVGATRAPTEYVLGLAAALAAGDLLSVAVLDPGLFWSADEVLVAEAIKSHFRGGGTFDGVCRIAAESRGA